MKHENIAFRLIDLQALVIELVNIERIIALPKGSKHHYENDAEHSFALAIVAWYICGFLPELDRSNVIKYALAHDFVEIYAGDVMAIGRTAQQQREKDIKEAKAVEQLKKDWPDFEDMTQAIDAYQNQSDKEAVFVKSLDKLMAVLVNINAKGRIWHEIQLDQDALIKNKDEKTKPHKEVHEIWKVLRQYLLDHPEYFS